MSGNQLTVKAPKALHDVDWPGGIGRRARDAAVLAIREGLAPVRPPKPQVERASCYLDPVSEDLIRRAATTYERPTREVVRDFSYAYWMQHYYSAIPDPSAEAEAEDADGEVDYVALLGMGNRPAQADLFGAITGALDKGRIAMAEGSTGVGKSRIIAGAALRACDTEAAPVVITAPSIAVLTQLAQEWRAAQAAAETTYQAVVRLGRSQFVDPTKLADLLTDPPADVSDADLTAAQEWLADGGPAVPDAEGFHLAAVDNRLAYLREDLERLAPGLPLDRVALERTEDQPLVADNPAEAIYRELAVASGDDGQADVILATHALVGAHLRLSRMGITNLLPERIPTLLVDEAHQLEEIVASTMGSDLSPQGLINLLQRPENADAIREARAKGVAERLKKAARTYRDAFKGASWQEAEFHLYHERDSYRAKQTRWFLDRLEDDLVELTDRLTGELGTHLQRLLTGIRARKTLSLVRVDLSPERRYPRIYLGPRSVGPWLVENLWGRAGAGAAVSATLYAVDANGNYTPAYMRHVLGIPKDRLASIFPKHAPWVWDIPQVLMPEAEEAEAWRPPTPPEQDQDWADIPLFYGRVAQVIRRATVDTDSGVVVLMTAYRDIALLADLLKPHLGDRLVVQQRGQPFSRGQRAYTDRVAAGDKPVWLATGVAWTGLDLGDAISDLIIPRMPGGTPTMTAQIRTREMRDAFRKERLMRMRQGMGRLVRSETDSRQRLWLLDGRLVATTRKDLHGTSGLRRLIRKYPHRYALPPEVRSLDPSEYGIPGYPTDGADGDLADSDTVIATDEDAR